MMKRWKQDVSIRSKKGLDNAEGSVIANCMHLWDCIINHMGMGMAGSKLTGYVLCPHPPFELVLYFIMWCRVDVSWLACFVF